MTAGRCCMIFTLGAAAGAVAALLFAPQKGEKTRRQIGRGLRDAGDHLRDFSEDVGTQANRAYKNAKDALEEARSRMTHCAADLTERVRSFA